MRRIALVLAVLLPLAASASALLAPAATDASARLVRAEVLLGDSVLLRGSTSDDGKPDVDQVWDYLRTLELQPTEAFAKLRARSADAAQPARDDGGWTLRRGEEDPWIHLRIAYGGRAEVHRLDFVPADDGRWRIAPADVGRYADLRWIRRHEAARLYGDD